MSHADPSSSADSEQVSAEGAAMALPTASRTLDLSIFTPPGGEPAVRDPYVGTDIDGRYTVEALLGTGGMGLVYRARHRAIDKTVAIKIMRADLAKDREANSRFATEARAASAVGSAHIVNVTDFGVVPDGSTYFVMEYLEGVTLARVLETSGRLPQRRLLAIAKQIAEGLGDAHQAGIIHRDLKPDNVFLLRHKGTDFVKILDFGIAKINSSKNRVTRTGQIFGTPHYMSPEQARGLPVDHRSDLYSLGAILYEMATGRVPFDGDNPMVVLSRHVHELPMPPSRLVQAEPPAWELDAVILKCLAKDPAYRYASMAELSEDLGALLFCAIPRAIGRRTGSVPTAVASFEASRGLEPHPAASARAPVKRRVARWALGLLAGAVVAGAATRFIQRPSPVMRPLFVYGATRVAAVLFRAAPQIEPGFSFSLADSTRPVALLLSPIDSEAFRNGRSLGTMPLTLHVPVGQKVAIVVKRDGYWSRAVLVDDTEPRQIVRLSPIPGAASAQTAPELEEPTDVVPPDGQKTEDPSESIQSVSSETESAGGPALASGAQVDTGAAPPPSPGKTTNAHQVSTPAAAAHNAGQKSPENSPQEAASKKHASTDGGDAQPRPDPPPASEQAEGAASSSEPSEAEPVDPGLPDPEPANPAPSDSVPPEPESASLTSPPPVASTGSQG